MSAASVASDRSASVTPARSERAGVKTYGRPPRQRARRLAGLALAACPPYGAQIARAQ